MERYAGEESYVCLMKVCNIGPLLSNIINYSGFHKDPKQNQIELHVFVPKDITLGKYSISGKILLLPIAGSGDLTFIYGEFRI